MNKKSLFLLMLILVNSVFISLKAQRPMEKLDRSVVAQKLSNGVYVNWRIPSDEWYNTSYKLYRNGSLIYTTTATGASNYLDTSGTISSKYTVSSVKNGVESAQSAQASVLSTPYLEIPLRDIKKLGKQGYLPNDATAADLDGDGQYEIIIKRLNKNWSETSTDFTYFEAYKMDGTFLWAIDVGPNITMDVEINIAAFDFDGDGKAEVFMRSSDNTVFGLDINNQGGVSVGDRDGDGYSNYRQAPFYGIGGDGFMNAGPEYLSLIDGMTGKELDWVNFIPRGSSSDWGDGYGHRANKFFFGAPYLDGKKPSLFIGRGIYTQTKMQTYDVVNKKLVPKWFWESGSYTNKQQGKWDETPKVYYGNGYHNYTIADVDDDGKDEINWGSMTVDDDGLPLYSTELGHGDAQHYGDFDPYRKGQEMFACNETKPGTNLRDAKTGKLLYRKVAASDVGRACAGNISDLYRGAEVWGGGVGLSATDRVEMSHFGLPENYCVYWDGDLLQEALDHNFSSSLGVGTGKIVKFNAMGSISTLLSADAYSCNYTKGTPCLQADIMGDWREESIWWRTDSLALRIYTTPYPTTNRIYTLMHDHQYRQAICWQMCGYNQPPHTSFYLGGDFPTPIPAKSTNGKLVYNGTNAVWNTANTNFFDGNDNAGLFAGTSANVSYADGKSVLFDEHSSVKNISINSSLQPELVMVAGNDDYNFSGTGTLSGAMILDKVGEGTLTINGNHSYTGKTDIWEGSLIYNGNLSSSPVTVRRHANFGGKVTIGSMLTTEFNASVFPGGIATADTMQVAGNLNWVNGAKIVSDLSDNPTIPNVAGTRSTIKNDYLQIDGTLQIGTGAVLLINEVADSLTEGKYLILKANAISGSVSSIKIQGTSGKSVSLNYDASSKELMLTITGTREATSVKWTGKTNNTWNIAKTINWSQDGYDDIFVNNDSLLFDNTGFSRAITLTDSVYVSDITVDVATPRYYSFSGTGSINGTGGITKIGNGVLTINTRNSISGKVDVNEGTLAMLYAPSTINNGGIGTNITNPAYLTVRDSATLQVITANEQTTRGLTLAGDGGGILNVTATLYWDGLITGTKLTKTGTATLFLGSNNSNLNETLLSAGTIKLNTDAAVQYGVGKKVTFLGGTLDTKNSTGSYLSSNHAMEVPEGITATVYAGARCEYNGALTGAGTLRWYVDYIRAYLNGNWSAFTGNINLLKNSANSTYEDHFIVNNSYGYPNATIDIATGVKMFHNSSSNTVRVGMLTGVGSFEGGALEVGSKNINGTFGGTINGTSSVKKIGTGTWTISGAHTYTGSTIVNAGTLYLTGSILNGAVTVQNTATFNSTGSIGNGAVTVQSGGTLNSSGSIGTGTITVQTGGTVNSYGTNSGNIIVQTGALLTLNGTCGGVIANSGTLYGTGTVNGSASLANGSTTNPGGTSIGKLTFKGSATMNTTSTLEVQVNGTNSADNMAVTGTFTCNGTLNVSMFSGLPTVGSVYQIITAGTIAGTFTNINLPTLDNTMEWDLSELYTLGKIKVNTKTAVNNPDASIKLQQNPTKGIFNLITKNLVDNTDYVVTDLTGKVLVNGLISSFDSTLKIDITSYPNGIYILRLKSDDYNTSFRLIKN